MKSFLIAFALSATLTLAAHGQQWQQVLADKAGKTITVPAGSLIEFGSSMPPVFGDTQEGLWAKFFFGDEAIEWHFSSPKSANVIAADKKYAGPLKITLGDYSINPDINRSIAVTYRITNTTGVSVLPSNAVVIPTSSGSTQIILESSTDLVTWTAATPGTYSSTTQNRFFHVCAVQHAAP